MTCNNNNNNNKNKNKKKNRNIKIRIKLRTPETSYAMLHAYIDKAKLRDPFI